MIAWLLDPCGRHGLGSAVLERLLVETFGPELAVELGRATTECEVAKGQCRADIVVRIGKAMLVIENKVDAPEAPSQCDELFAEWGSSVRYLLLTPDGRRPRSATEAALGQFKSMSYPRLRAVIEQALTASQVDGPGRWIVQDYLRTLAREFS